MMIDVLLIVISFILGRLCYKCHNFKKRIELLELWIMRIDKKMNPDKQIFDYTNDVHR